MIVMKFGGTSVQDAAAIRRVIEIVRGRLPEKPLVVVSALARVTRLLVDIAAAQDQTELLEALRTRHTDLCEELLTGALFTDTLEKVEQLCESIEGQHDEPTVISVGELLSSTIVSAAFNQAGIPCRWVDARDVLQTSGDRMSGRPDLGRVTECAPEVFRPNAGLAVTQGFIATSEEGLPSVLGFEGSDYSAAIFGMALDAARVEIWTDVDGIRTADPRYVPETCRILRVSYDEAAEMARLGARVLHPMTIYPARTKQIPIRVLNTGNPSCPGSQVEAESADGPKCVALLTLQDSREIGSRALAGETAGQALVSVIGRNLGEEERLAVEAVSGKEATVAPLSVSVTVDADRAKTLVTEIHNRLFL